jgi:hypothetical protein
MNQDINNRAVRVLRDYTGRGPTSALRTSDLTGRHQVAGGRG